MKQHIKSFAIVALIIAATVGLPLTVNAIDRATARRFAENNILFYDPSGSSGCSSTAQASTVLAGIQPSVQSGTNLENAKLVLARLTADGYSPIAAAAIAGNLEWEGGFYPCKVENGSYDTHDNKYNSGASCDTINKLIDAYGNNYILELRKKNGEGTGRAGVGIVQWTSEGRQQGLIDLANGRGVKVTDLDVQVDFLVQELQSWRSNEDVSHRSSVDILNDVANGADGLIQATWRIYRYYETPATSFKWEGGSGDSQGSQNKKQPTDPLTLNETDHAGAYKEFYQRRLSSALYYLNLLESGGQVGTGSGTSPISGSDVAVIIDGNTPESLKSALSEKLSGIEFVSDFSSSRKYIIYTARMTEAIGKEEIENIAASVPADKTIFFVNNQVSTINAVKEVAGSKENVRALDYTSGTEADLANKAYQAVQAVINAKKRSFDPCVGGQLEGVTYKELNGFKYAFPLLGATQKNYLYADSRNGSSGLSHVTYGYDFSKPLIASYGVSNSWHHDYPAMDLGLKYDSNVHAHEYSAGAKVVALVDGQITTYSEYNRGSASQSPQKCASIFFEGVDGRTYWIGHTTYKEEYAQLKSAEKIAAGTVIGEIGPSQCTGNNSQAHVHIDNRNCGPTNGVESDGAHYCEERNGVNYSSYIIDIVIQLAKEIPES